MSKKVDIDLVVGEAMSDLDINHYLTRPTVKYCELSRYNSIDELLPNDIDYVVLLIESNLNSGHWICCLKYNNLIEYFDSYGNAPSAPLKWNNKIKNKELGQDIPYLNNLFNKTNKKIIYNDIDYQAENPVVNSCGAHCCFRILQLLENNKTLQQYNKLMQKTKKETGLNYDQIVSAFINKR
jgi:hypothetical protein